MAGLVPAIHVLTANEEEDVDARDKRGHDDVSNNRYLTTAAVWPNSSLRSSSVRIGVWPKFGLMSLAMA